MEAVDEISNLGDEFLSRSRLGSIQWLCPVLVPFQSSREVREETIDADHVAPVHVLFVRIHVIIELQVLVVVPERVRVNLQTMFVGSGNEIGRRCKVVVGIRGHNRVFPGTHADNSEALQVLPVVVGGDLCI